MDRRAVQNTGQVYVTNPDQINLVPFGSPTPSLAVSPNAVPIDRHSDGPGNHDKYASMLSASFNMGYYIDINPEIRKSYAIHPTSQGQRAAVQQRMGPMMGVTRSNTRPRNNPARMQFSEGYTIPIQDFSATSQQAGNTWQTPSGRNSRADRLSQPSMKAVSPFASVPIPTRMPWDL